MCKGVLHNASTLIAKHHMKSKPLLVILGLASLGACAQSPIGQAPSSPAAEPRSLAVGSKAVGLTGPILYQFLLGELAGQRGDLSLASDAYVDLARKTRDVRVVKRAAEIASHARHTAQAIEMSRLWLELEPKSARARQALASQLVSVGLLDEARPQLEAMLRLDERPVADAFMQLHSLLARHKDKKAILDLVKELAGAYPALPESKMAVAHAALNAGQDAQALQFLDEALQLNPGWESAVLLKAQVLARKGDDAASLAMLRDYIERNPQANQVRLSAAKLLAKAGRYAEARNEFEALLAIVPNNAEFRFALGILAMQMNDLDTAEQHLGLALDQGYHDESQIRMYLGQLNEGRQRYEKALEWYQKIEPGEHYVESRLKAAIVLGKLSRVDEGKALLRELEADDAVDDAQVIQAEAQMLREARRFEEALDLLGKALEKDPEAADLL